MSARYVAKVQPTATVCCERCPSATELRYLSEVEPDGPGSLTEWWCPACVVEACDLATVPIQIQRAGGVRV